MAEFILLLHEDPSSFSEASPEEMQGVVSEYFAWRDGLMQNGQLVGGNKLKDEGGRSLSRQSGNLRVVDGPFAEAKEVMGGYFIIAAADYDAAIEVASSCPHLKFGGRIELREIDPLHDDS
jgi:hypothetical protein